MMCPAGCNQTLLMAERHNVQIDYCPQCRGVWLDKGELEKIIDTVERHAAVTSGVPTLEPSRQAPPAQAPPAPRYDRYDDDDDDYYRKYGKRKKKKSLLGEIFDFD